MLALCKAVVAGKLGLQGRGINEARASQGQGPARCKRDCQRGQARLSQHHCQLRLSP
jgi:hypothetical protein